MSTSKSEKLGSQAVDFTGESELLPRDVPPLVIRAISVFIVLLFSVGLTVAVAVPLPDIVKSPFTLAPAEGADPVKAPMPGTIERVAVSDGSEVRSGDVLFVIRSEDLGVLSERVKRIEKEIEAQAPLEVKLTDSSAANIKAAETRAESLASEIGYAKKRKGVSGQLLDMAEGSFKKGLVSEQQLLAARQADADAGQALERLRREAEDARAAVAQLKALGQKEAAERAIQLARLRGELAEARAAIDWREQHERPAGEENKENVYAVTAPYDGTVTGMGPRRAGALVERGEVLCRIAKANARLLAEIAVPELDAGRLQHGQHVKLLLDAFPYTRYGTRSATVTWVSPTAAEGRIRVQASPRDPYVVVDGTKKPLRAGMIGQAHILVGSRTLAEYALEPLAEIRENLRGVDEEEPPPPPAE